MAASSLDLRAMINAQIEGLQELGRQIDAMPQEGSQADREELTRERDELREMLRTKEAELQKSIVDKEAAEKTAAMFKRQVEELQALCGVRPVTFQASKEEAFAQGEDNVSQRTSEQCDDSSD